MTLTLNDVRRIIRGGSSPPRQRRRARPLYDKKTVALVATDAQLVQLERFCAAQAKLWHRLVTSAAERLDRTGWCENTHDLAYLLPGLKTADPDLRILPAEAGQNTARAVTQALKEQLGDLHRTDRPLSREERAEAKLHLVEQRRAQSIHVNRVTIERHRLRLPKLGWVAYTADAVLREVLSGEGNILVRGCRVWRLDDDGQWRATISFLRLSKTKIEAAAKLGKAIAEGLYEPEEATWRGVLYAVDDLFGPGDRALSTAEILDGLKRAHWIREEISAKRLSALMREAGLTHKQVTRGGKVVWGFRRRDVMLAVGRMELAGDSEW